MPIYKKIPKRWNTNPNTLASATTSIWLMINWGITINTPHSNPNPMKNPTRALNAAQPKDSASS